MQKHSHDHSDSLDLKYDKNGILDLLHSRYSLPHKQNEHDHYLCTSPTGENHTCHPLANYAWGVHDDAHHLDHNENLYLYHNMIVVGMDLYLNYGMRRARQGSTTQRV